MEAQKEKDKRYYWLKLFDGWFDKDSRRIILSKPDGGLYIVILLELYLKSMNTNGQLPYNEEDLCALTSAPALSIFQKAISLFLTYELIIIDGGYIFFPEVPGMVGSESKWAQYKRKDSGKQNWNISNSASDVGNTPMGSVLENVQFNTVIGKFPTHDALENLQSGVNIGEFPIQNEKKGAEIGNELESDWNNSNKRIEILAGSSGGDKNASAVILSETRARIREGGDGAAATQGKGFIHYVKYIGYPTESELKELYGYLKFGMDDMVIYEAVEDAHANGKCTHVYVTSILERCRQQNILTQQTYIAEREAHKKDRASAAAQRKTAMSEDEARKMAQRGQPALMDRIWSSMGLGKRTGTEVKQNDEHV